MDDTILNNVLNNVYTAWGIGSYLTRELIISYAKETYPLLVERAKAGKPIYYGELPVFWKIQHFYGVVPKVIGMIVGICSQYDLDRGLHAISAIVVNQNHDEPGDGFYGLSHTPISLSSATWEKQGRTPTPEIRKQREEFWHREYDAVIADNKIKR